MVNPRSSNMKLLTKIIYTSILGEVQDCDMVSESSTISGEENWLKIVISQFLTDYYGGVKRFDAFWFCSQSSAVEKTAGEW